MLGIVMAMIAIGGGGLVAMKFAQSKGWLDADEHFTIGRQSTPTTKTNTQEQSANGNSATTQVAAPQAGIAENQVSTPERAFEAVMLEMQNNDRSGNYKMPTIAGFFRNLTLNPNFGFGFASEATDIQNGARVKAPPVQPKALAENSPTPTKPSLRTGK